MGYILNSYLHGLDQKLFNSQPAQINLSRSLERPPEVFRGILFEVCASKLGGLMTPEFQFGLGQVVVALGTSLAKTHEHYKARLKLLTSCWKEVNANDEEEAEEEVSEENGEEQEKKTEKEEDGEKEAKKAEESGDGKDVEKGEQEQEAETNRHGAWKDNDNLNIPKTFAAMARFNAAVMGTGDRIWFGDMLYAMESLVPYIGNIDRVQEDCDVLTLTLAKYGQINLKDSRVLGGEWGKVGLWGLLLGGIIRDYPSPIPYQPGPQKYVE